MMTDQNVIDLFSQTETNDESNENIKLDEPIYSIDDKSNSIESTNDAQLDVIDQQMKQENGSMDKHFIKPNRSTYQPINQFNRYNNQGAGVGGGRFRKKRYENVQFDNYPEPFDDEETINERDQREVKLKRNLHNQKAYFNQRNNIESDTSDIQSDCSNSSERLYTLDERMREMVTMFNQSFVPYGL